jgi:hypothetical protein
MPNPVTAQVEATAGHRTVPRLSRRQNSLRTIKPPLAQSTSCQRSTLCP